MSSPPTQPLSPVHAPPKGVNVNITITYPEQAPKLQRSKRITEEQIEFLSQYQKYFEQVPESAEDYTDGTWCQENKENDSSKANKRRRLNQQ